MSPEPHRFVLRVPDVVRVVELFLNSSRTPTTFHVSLNTNDVSVDKAIFYRLAKFMYSRTYNPFKLSQHYATLPMLYGCWHPYKYVCTMIHRKFFPILGYLGQQMPAVDGEIMCHVKLLHIEKQFCAHC